MQIVDQLRHRAATSLWAIRRRRSDPRHIHSYISSNDIRKLQIGAGPNPLEGWLNTDLLPDLYPDHRANMVRLDATGIFPLPDASFDYIASEHQIEHLAVDDCLAMLRECYRVLRPHGRIRIATPDLASVLGLYGQPLDGHQKHYVEWVMRRFWPDIHTEHPQPFVINQMFHAYGHQFIYDRASLTMLLTQAGFREVTDWKPGESADPRLRGVESHGRSLGDEQINSFETMVLEAIRSTAP